MSQAQVNKDKPGWIFHNFLPWETCSLSPLTPRWLLLSNKLRNPHTNSLFVCFVLPLLCPAVSLLVEISFCHPAALLPGCHHYRVCLLSSTKGKFPAFSTPLPSSHPHSSVNLLSTICQVGKTGVDGFVWRLWTESDLLSCTGQGVFQKK